MKILIAAAFLFLWSCHHDDKPEKIAPTPPDIQHLYDVTADRLLGMLDRGFVVSRLTEAHDDRAEGAIWHEGDALIFSGIAMAQLSCADGAPIEDALLAMVDETGGGFYRHPDLPDQISLDGMIGAYRGIMHRIATCEASAEKWAPRLQAHLAKDRGWPLGFRYIPELALAVATGGGHPDPRRLDDLLGTLESWALAVQVAHAACFRVNLGYQTIRTAEEAREPIPALRRDNFCTVTRGMGLPTVDNWCGRQPIADWVYGFAYNEYEYRHQRCQPDWEQPDGKDWLQTPAVDLLEGIREGFTLDP